MSTSDQQRKEPLTRKQLREIRLTGAAPVVTEEEAAAPAPAPVPPRPAEPVRVPPAPVAEKVDLGAAPLTRRQAREQERIRTASVPVLTPEGPDAEASPGPAAAEGAEPGATEARKPAPEVVSSVPAFAPAAPEEKPTPEEEPAAEELFAVDEAVDADPLSSASAVGPASDAEVDLVALGVDAEAIEDIEDDETEGSDAEERPTVSPAFGQSVLSEEKHIPAFAPSFDELIASDDSTGSQHIAPSALIFNPAPGDGSLSGPVASTGEILITGSYDLPEGLGSQGHANGTTDGKEIDAVLIDGELPPASSPTPIAASSAISTSKPAGEVIRPPAPEKGNKLMLALAITAGGLALVLAAALFYAFTTNVF